jgi:hypothetical protein
MTPRVVLNNATEGTVVSGQEIGAHTPTLRIAASDIVGIDSLALPGTSDPIIEWQLNGVRMKVENGITAPRQDAEHFHCIPSLRQLASDIGPPSMAAIENEDPTLTSCIFDVFSGTVGGGALRADGAVFSVLHTETDGPPRLSITSFGSRTPKIITLVDDAEITIANLGATALHDGHFDFYLHYRLAEKMPDVMAIPEGSATECVVNEKPAPTWVPGFGSVDPGCSNSTYP